MAGGYPCCCSFPIRSGSSGTFIDSSSGIVSVECSCCRNHTAPFQIQVVVDGVTTSFAGACADCTDYNAAYVLDWTDDLADGTTYCMRPGSLCWWKLDFPEICGRTKAHFVLVCTNETSGVLAQFSLMPTDCFGGGQWMRWETTFPADPAGFDCMFDGLELSRANVLSDNCLLSPTTPVRVYAV